jgi:hypothetical protein
MEATIQSHDQFDLPDRLAGLAGNLLGRHSRGRQRPGLAVPLAELTAGTLIRFLFDSAQIGNGDQDRLIPCGLVFAPIEE